MDKKYPDHLVVSCKHLSIYQMAAGLRLPRSSPEFLQFFQTCKTLTGCPSDLENLCCKVLNN